MSQTHVGPDRGSTANSDEAARLTLNYKAGLDRLSFDSTMVSNRMVETK